MFIVTDQPIPDHGWHYVTVDPAGSEAVGPSAGAARGLGQVHRGDGGSNGSRPTWATSRFLRMARVRLRPMATGAAGSSPVCPPYRGDR